MLGIGSSIAVIEALPFRHSIHGKWRSHLLLRGENVPAVDVIVTCCNEDPDIILNTVRAALALDYPSNRFRVVLTDDGNSPEVLARVSALAAHMPNLFYTTRKKNGPAGFKAGNLNHAVKFVASLPQGPAEMIAGLDADMIPEKRWLRVIVAHLVQDAGLGLACPPQVRDYTICVYIDSETNSTFTTFLQMTHFHSPCFRHGVTTKFSETWQKQPGALVQAGLLGDKP